MRKSLNFLLPKNFKQRFPYLFEILRAFKNNDIVPLVRFYFSHSDVLTLGQKGKLIRQFFYITTQVNSPHRHVEILSFVRAMIESRDLDGVYVECGCFKGSSSAKFSLVAQLLGKKLIIFDSFEGIPDNDENHDFNIYGERSGFRKGDFKGALEEVQHNIATYGDIQSCEFVKGWFDHSMPGFQQPVSAAYIDVDLASSTKTCLQYLYPLVHKGGVMMSQDGHLPLVIDVFKDTNFWQQELQVQPPQVVGLGSNKIIFFNKK
jgi:O-methyltransferase